VGPSTVEVVDVVDRGMVVVVLVEVANAVVVVIGVEVAVVLVVDELHDVITIAAIINMLKPNQISFFFMFSSIFLIRGAAFKGQENFSLSD
jgi:hypothetical protein